MTFLAENQDFTNAFLGDSTIEACLASFAAQPKSSVPGDNYDPYPLLECVTYSDLPATEPETYAFSSLSRAKLILQRQRSYEHESLISFQV